MISTEAARGVQPRAVVIVALIGLAAASWAYITLLSTRMGDMPSTLMMPMTSSWSAVEAAVMFTMWVVMMAAMMLPSAVPMVLTYDRMHRSSSDEQGGSAALFVAGYVVVWSVFAGGAAGIQWILQGMALVDGMGELTQRGTAGLVLIGAGLFQFSTTKRRSLAACRTPLGFLTTSWRGGRGGALGMGVHHGTLCLRCCWAVMALLFVLGVMNLIWVACLAAFVIAEKMFPRGEVISAVGGGVMIVCGIAAILGG